MQVCLVLLAIIPLGHALSTEASCSIQDIQICNTCKNVQCEVDSNRMIGSFTDVSSSDECQDWCRQRNDYMGDCRYLTYFGNKGHPVKNTCYIFPSCGQKTECEDCVTETFDCFCSSSIIPNMEGTKPLHRFDDIISEGECRQKCRHDTRCEFYTYIADSHKCYLLSQLIKPFHNCNGCRTGKANCTEAPITTSTTTGTTFTTTTASTSLPSTSLSTTFTTTPQKSTSTTSNTSTTPTTTMITTPSTTTTTTTTSTSTSTSTPTTTSITTTTELSTTATTTIPTTMPPGWCDSDSRCQWDEACVDHFCQNVCTPTPCTHSHEVCAVSNHKAFCPCDSGWVREPTGGCGRPTQPTTMPTTTTTTAPTTTSITTTTEPATTDTTKPTTKPPGWCDSDSKCKWAEACVDHSCQNVCTPTPCTHLHEFCAVSWLTKHKAFCQCDFGWVREPTGECAYPTQPTTIPTTTTTTPTTTAPTTKCQIVLNDLEHSKHMSYKFDSGSEQKSFTVSSPGCFLRVLAVGGGGHAACKSGAGSGYVSYKETSVSENVEYQVTVGKGGHSEVTATASKIDTGYDIMIMASAGHDSQMDDDKDCYGGGGFSGGGGDDDGGYDGGDGYGSYGHQFPGSGSGHSIGNYYMKNFVLKPGHSGRRFGIRWLGGRSGGGGGGVLVNGKGPSPGYGQGMGQGYGGGGSGREEWKSGLDGVVLVEIYRG